MKSGSGRRIANNLVALSSAAVLTVYAAGYMKTRAAAQRLENAGHRETFDPPALRAPAPEPTPRPLADVQPQPAPPPAVEAKPRVEAPPAPKPTTSIAVATTPPAMPVAAPASTPAELVPPAAPVSPAATPVAATSAAVAPPTAPPDADPKPAEPPAPKPSPYKDGTYVGWGTSRHGSIEATVTIEGGKIVGSAISQCLTRYSCSWIAHLVPQVVARQSANVDYVSGATQSTYAFYDAVVEALSKAK
jgi:uncharacterized protein with FMN-binding domain